MNSNINVDRRKYFSIQSVMKESITENNTVQKKLKKRVTDHLPLGTSTQNSQTEFQSSYCKNTFRTVKGHLSLDLRWANIQDASPILLHIYKLPWSHHTED